MFASAIPLKFVLGVDYPTAIILLAVVALLYTFAGGARGVIWVDAVQMVIYLTGAVVAAIVLVSTFPGGWGESPGLPQKEGNSRCSIWGREEISGGLHTRYLRGCWVGLFCRWHPTEPTS